MQTMCDRLGPSLTNSCGVSGGTMSAPGRIPGVGSAQTLSEEDRRNVAVWAADCAERVLGLFEAEAPEDDRPREAIARLRAFALGELGVAEARRRFVAHAAAREVTAPAAVAAARAAGQAASIPPVGENASGPLGPGLLASGLLGAIIRDLQAALADPGRLIREPTSAR
jgi:hypothetical protein